MRLFIVTSIAIGLGTSAMAQTPRYSATLAEPLAAKKELIVNSNAWRCEGSTCSLVSPPNDPFSVRSCHELARLVGTIAAYGSGNRTFDADKLAKCNGKG
jgi:hypothetical protein